MISVSEAQQRILAAFEPLAAEVVPVSEGLGRVLAEDLAARVTQPPADVSAMDGYAVRGADVAEAGAELTVVGEIAAGSRLEKPLGPGEAARIFTGAPLPPGADTIVIQENVTAEDGRIRTTEPTAKGRFVREAGLDFKAGDIGLTAGMRLGPRDLGFAAAMDRPWLSLHRRPRVAILATGDEIAMPGEPRGPSHIVSSNAIALSGVVEAEGGLAVNLGIAPDRAEALQIMARGAQGCDLLITTGGASVGKHDLVRSALGETGLDLDFWKIAMRPGKPLLFGRLGDTPLLGLPGNPVSSLVCALIFLRPILRRLQGLEPILPPLKGRLAVDLGANDEREDYLRSLVERDASGAVLLKPFSKQDSSMLATLARAGALSIRPPHAPPAKAGDPIDYIPL